MNRKYVMRSEGTEQEDIISWCYYHETQYPELKWIYHCPNGGKRNAQEAAKFKRQGVKAGVPDLHLPVAKGRYIGLYIELKYEGGKLQKTQREWLEAMQAAGHYTCTCYGYETAVKIIEQYVTLKSGEEMSQPNGAVLKQGGK